MMTCVSAAENFIPGHCSPLRYDLSTVITDVARVGSVVNVASKLSSASFDAQLALDEMPTSGWRSPSRFLDV
jgi:hypothetical protein